MKIGKMAPLSCGDFTVSQELDVWVKDEELHPEFAATLANFHQFLLVLVGLFWRQLSVKSSFRGF